MKNIRVYFSSIIDQTLSPPRCLLCQLPSQQRFPLCRGCEQDLPWLNSYCLQCAEPLPESPTLALIGPQAPVSLRCGHCLQQPPAFTLAYAPLRYEFPIDLLMQRIKHRADYHSIELLSRLFCQRLQQHAQHLPLPQQLLPVPLHSKRLRQRGFNQSLELALSIGQRLGIPVNTKLCSRELDTPHQQGLSAIQRRRNLTDAFRVNQTQLDRIGGAHVALIDDVMTTGTTAHMLASTLRRAGVEQIDIWCLARTPAGRQHISGLPSSK